MAFFVIYHKTDLSPRAQIQAAPPSPTPRSAPCALKLHAQPTQCPYRAWLQHHAQFKRRSLTSSQRSDPTPRTFQTQLSALNPALGSNSALNLNAHLCPQARTRLQLHAQLKRLLSTLKSALGSNSALGSDAALYPQSRARFQLHAQLKRHALPLSPAFGSNCAHSSNAALYPQPGTQLQPRALFARRSFPTLLLVRSALSVRADSSPRRERCAAFRHSELKSPVALGWGAGSPAKLGLGALGPRRMSVIKLGMLVQR